MRFAKRAAVAGAAGVAVAVLAGCGSSGALLSAGQAGTLNQQLTQISQALHAGQCSRAANEISTFQNEVDNLGAVNSTLVSNLDQGASTIAQLSAKQCPTTRPEPAPKPKTTTQMTQTVTTPPPTTSTPTTSTPSTTQTTTPTTTTSTTSTTGTTGGVGVGGGPATGGAGPGNGNGNRNGGGGGDSPPLGGGG
jgi:hypothetical protein